MTTTVGILLLLNILDFGQVIPNRIKELKHTLAWGLIIIGLPEIIISYIRIIERLA